MNTAIFELYIYIYIPLITMFDLSIDEETSQINISFYNTMN